FDADATVTNGLYGWLSLEVTDDPIGVPSFSLYPAAGNYEGGVIPRNGVEIQISSDCAAGIQVRVGHIHELRDYVDYTHTASIGAVCFATSSDHLNHFEVRLSQSRVEVWASPFSADGLHFAAPTLVASA